MYKDDLGDSWILLEQKKDEHLTIEILKKTDGFDNLVKVYDANKTKIFNLKT